MSPGRTQESVKGLAQNSTGCPTECDVGLVLVTATSKDGAARSHPTGDQVNLLRVLGQ